MKFAQTIVTLIIALHMLATVAEAAPRQVWQKTPRQQQTAAHDSQPELDPLLMPEDLSVFGESRMPPYIRRSPEFWESDRQEIMELAPKVIHDLPSPYKELVERELQKTDYRNPPNFYYFDDKYAKIQRYALFDSPVFALTYSPRLGFTSVRDSLQNTPMFGCLEPDADIIAGKKHPIISYPTELMQALSPPEREYAELCLSLVNENIDALERFQFLKIDPKLNAAGRYACKYVTAPFLVTGKRVQNVPNAAQGNNPARFKLQTVLGYYAYNPKILEYDRMGVGRGCESTYRICDSFRFKVIPTLIYLDLPMRPATPKVQNAIANFQLNALTTSLQDLQKGIDTELLKEYRYDLGRMSPALRVVMEGLHRQASQRIKEDLRLITWHQKNLTSLKEARQKMPWGKKRHTPSSRRNQTQRSLTFRERTLE